MRCYETSTKTLVERALFRKWYMLSYENLKIFLKFTLMQTSKDEG